jgi:hypothetical protein
MTKAFLPLEIVYFCPVYSGCKPALWSNEGRAKISIKKAADRPTNILIKVDFIESHSLIINVRKSIYKIYGTCYANL